MKTTHYDDQEVSSLVLLLPALPWLAFFAIAAVGGALSRDEPGQTADLAVATQLQATESAAVSPVSHSAIVVHDAAVAAHEELDPVGVGLNSTR